MAHLVGVLVLDRERAHEVRGHRRERLLGPRQEPVDGAAVDQTREGLGARAELGPDGREAEREVEVGAHALDEEGPQVVLRRLRALEDALVHGADLADDDVVLVAREEVGQLACATRWGVGVEEDVANPNPTPTPTPTLTLALTLTAMGGTIAHPC